jgi:hypothetical protein
MVLAGACSDSVIRELEPGNDQIVVNLPDSFTYIATNLENVSDKVEFEWTNSEPRLTLNHLSFLPHGYGLLIIRDAVGVVVDSTILEYQLVTESRVGVPGPWTITLIYTGAFGRAQFSLVPLAVSSASRAAAPVSPGQPEPGLAPGQMPLQEDARGAAARGTRATEPAPPGRGTRLPGGP